MYLYPNPYFSLDGRVIPFEMWSFLHLTHRYWKVVQVTPQNVKESQKDAGVVDLLSADHGEWKGGRKHKEFVYTRLPPVEGSVKWKRVVTSVSSFQPVDQWDRTEVDDEVED